MRLSLKHGRSSTSLDYVHDPYLKKQRVEILRFCSSSVISGNRVSPVNTPPLTKTSEINGLIENKHCGVRRSYSSDHDDDESVSSPAQSDITEQQRRNLGYGSDGCEKGGGVDVSESKSVRVEMLKKRFSQIIGKATQLQEKVDRSDDLKLDDSVKMQVEKQILIEKKKLKEAQIVAEAESKMESQRKREAVGEALLKATQVQLLEKVDKSDDLKLDDSVMQVEKQILIEKKLKETQIAAEAESKMELQRKRKAARKALLELEKTVEVNDNIKTMKDFAVLLGYPRNSAACNRKEIGWYGTGVVYWRRTKVEGGAFEEQFKERVRRMRLNCLNMYR